MKKLAKHPAKDNTATVVAKKVGSVLGTLAANTRNLIDSAANAVEPARKAPASRKTRAKKAAKKRARPAAKKTARAQKKKVAPRRSR